MILNLKYGRTGLDVEFEESTTVFRTRDMPVIGNPTARLKEFLERPIATLPLGEIARGRRNACIVVSDITRPVPNKILLPPIIETLKRSGMRPDDIFFLVATGLHRAPTDAELREIFGEELLAAHRVVSHDARDESRMSRIGRTGRGTPIDINRAFLESDLRIVIGLVEPHFMAGYSGGRKSVAIGLCSVESVKRLHGTGFLEHPGARNCELGGNPLHAELTEIAAAAGVDFCVSAVIDAGRRIGGIFCGDVVESHAAACEFAEKYCVARSDRAFDVVVTTAGGYPLDTTYYQAVKGLVGALDILSPGGALILASECSAGLGSAEFRLGLERLRELGDCDDFLRHIAEPANFVVDQWEVEMLVKALRGGDIYMYSTGLPDFDWPLTFARRVGSVREGLDLASAGRRGAGRIAVIPEGPYVIPKSDDGTVDERRRRGAHRA